MASYQRKRRRRLNPRFVLLCLILTLLLTGGIGLVLRLLPRELEAEDVTVPDWVEKDYLTPNPWSRPGTELEEIRAVVIHYVGNPDTTAQANRDYFDSLKSGRERIYASSHFVVGLEGEVLQCVPLTEIAHASNERNVDTVAIEVCHPDETGQFSAPTYDSVVKLAAWLCRTFALDPAEDVIRHYDVTGKLCPLYYVENEAAWSALREDIGEEMAYQAALEASEAPELP